jgi:diadenosine tetraphosphate (Ap4A) HIT family hydrolase
VACPLCDRVSGDPGAMIPVAVLEECAVFLGENQGCPGWCVLVLREHAEHLDEVPIERQRAVFGEVAWVARAIRRVFAGSGAGGGPPRINYECLGNQVPHVHWHVIPRHADDPDPRQAVWGWPAERLLGTMAAHERAALARAIAAAMSPSP